MKRYLTLILCFTIATIAFAQSNYQDVVYLKNGSIIRGIIIEQVPNKSIKIETADKNIFVYQIEEVEKITKEIPAKKKANQTNTENRKGFTAINIGTSIPTGNFGSKDFYTNTSGYASIGLISDFSFGYEVHPNFGITALLRSQVNGLDAGAYAQDLANYLGAGSTGSTSVTVETSSYSLGGIMAGVYGSFPISEKLSFEPRLLLGFSTPILPSMTTETYGSGTKFRTYIKEQAVSFAFSYIIGSGVKLNLSKKISLLLNADFYAANAEWKNVQEISIGHITGTTEIRNYDFYQNFRTLNFTTGIGFRF